MSPLISVVIANYNNGRYLSQCIESVLAQTYNQLEIVIADDLSTDGSQKIITGYAQRHPNIVPVFNVERMGVTANRKRAIERSTGEFVTTLDSDDFYYANEKLEREMELMNGSPGSDGCVVAFSDTILVSERGALIGNVMKKRPIKEGEILPYLMARKCAIPRDMTFRRADYDAIGGYDTSLSLYEDWDLKLRLASRCRYAYTGVAGTAYRVTPTGLSRGACWRNARVMHHVFMKNFALLDQNRLRTAAGFYHETAKMIARQEANKLLRLR